MPDPEKTSQPPAPANILEAGELCYKVMADYDNLGEPEWIETEFRTSMLIQFADLADLRRALAEGRVELIPFGPRRNAAK